MAVQVESGANLESVERLEDLQICLDDAHDEGRQRAAKTDCLNTVSGVSDIKSSSKHCNRELRGEKDEAAGHPDTFVCKVMSDIVQVNDHPKETSESADEATGKN